MGEKLLAQHVLIALRDTVRHDGKAGEALLEWTRDQADWLWPGAEVKIDWDGLHGLARAIDTDGPEPELFGCTDAIADLLELEEFERALLRLTAAFRRLPRLASLCSRLPGAGVDMVALSARLAGLDSVDILRRVRRSALFTLGLVSIWPDASGGTAFGPDWPLTRVLDDERCDEEKLIAALAGIRQHATLDRKDFAEHKQAFGLLKRLLAGALERRAPGINILIYGPPGTGKTELARTLADCAGARLYAVGESDEDDQEPSRYERLHALQRAQRLLARSGDSIILFDEMEDLFTEANHSAGGGRRAGSKIFVNRLLESNKVPTIWTSNAIFEVDRAHLRRLSYILRMDHPSARARTRIAARAAAAERAGEAVSGLDPLLANEPEAASIARAALRSAALAGGGAADAEAAGRSLLLGLRGGRALPPAPTGGELDLGLYESDPPIAPLMDRLAASGGASDFSLLLTGPPGTGKTALAAHLAERLDRPLAVKRASDLLSKWVGGTEANIADAFADAREAGSVLLFDEVDSLLLDRTDARQSWEISQVNELLTWMDSHPLPFVAATNWSNRLDPAALRRFVFKIELAPLSGAAAERAWARFFPGEAPAGLGRVPGLTPGDFAVVARQLRHRPDAAAAAILGLLEAEARAKPDRSAKIGF